MSRSQNYWEMKQQAYPFQVKVPHMSNEDVDPRKAQELLGWNTNFLRVPFNGVAHWGFQSQEALDLFNHIVSYKRRT